MHLLQLSQWSGWYTSIKKILRIHTCTCSTYLYLFILFSINQVPEISMDTRFVRHRVFIFEQTANRAKKQFVTKSVKYSVNMDRKFSVVIHSLVKNTVYKIKIRTELKGLCLHLPGNSGYVVGRLSLVPVKTAEERKFVHCIRIAANL